MKNPFEMTLSEVSALIGDTPELMVVVCQTFNKQQEIKGYLVKQTHDLIKNKPKEKAVEPKIFLSEKEFAELA